METKQTPINIQDDFLNRIRREKLAIHIYLVNGKKLVGKVKAFDRFTVQLVSGSSEQLVFKHAIATILIATGSGQGDMDGSMND